MKTIQFEPNKKTFNIALVTGKFNSEITERLYHGAIERLLELEFKNEQITSVWVPGAIEISLTAQKLAKTGNFRAIICLGAVIRGDTSHFDYVCQQITQGCLDVSLNYEIPVIFGILTTENEEQAFERTGGAYGHKGIECVDTAIEMVSVLEQIEKL